MKQFYETWAISYGRIADFLCSQGAEHTEPSRFLFDRVEVRVTSLPPRRIGALSFPCTLMEFAGEDCETEKLHRRFVLQFISAGG